MQIAATRLVLIFSHEAASSSGPFFIGRDVTVRAALSIAGCSNLADSLHVNVHDHV